MQEHRQDFILRVKACLTPWETVHNASILCGAGRIQALGGYSALRVLEDTPCIDMSDCRAVPGLVDTHIHGSGGFAAMDVEESSNLAAMSSVLARHGVTSFVLTVLSAERAKMVRVIEALAAAHEQELTGAVPAGIHLEGPYLNSGKAGAQAAPTIRGIDVGEAEALIEAGGGHVKTMTFAPELDQSERLIERLLAHGVVPSMGHSLADEAQARRAIAAGASRCTHLFNGMPPLDQRESGLTVVALTEDKLTIELIVDGKHVHPRMVDLACRAKPRSGVVGISDAVQGAGLADGRYRYGGQEVEVRDGTSRRVSDGTLAGAALTLDEGLRNLARFTSLSDAESLACFTANAATSVGYDDRGVIKPGKRADIAVVDDEWRVKMTIVNGRVAFDGRDG